MDEKEYTELEKLMQDDEVSGHLGQLAQVKKRSGRGFKWNAETGKYTQL